MKTKMKTNQTILNNRYTITGVLGSGAYGKVYKVEENKHLKREFALKTLNDSEAKEKFYKELELMHTLAKEPNIISLYDYEEYEEKLYIFSEFKNGGNLKEYIQSNGILSEDEAIVFLNKMLNAIEYALNQNPPIYHKDIKPENILLHTEINTIDYFLADWGLANIKLSSSKSKDKSGTMDYVAPEVFIDGKRYESSDIYSLGTVLHYILTDYLPYGYKLTDDIETNVLMGKIFGQEPTVRDSISPKLKTIIEKMISKDPKQRASIDEIRELLKDDVRQSFEMGDFEFGDSKDEEIKRLKSELEDSKFLDSETQVLYEQAMSKNTILKCSFCEIDDTDKNQVISGKNADI